MEYEYIFRHMEPTEAIKSYAEGKCEKLTKYMIKPVRLKITFSTVRFEQHVDMTLFESHHVFEAHGLTHDMYASIDQAVHGLEEQLRRYKEKVTEHKIYEVSREGRLRGAQNLEDAEHLSAAKTYYEQNKKKKK